MAVKTPTSFGIKGIVPTSMIDWEGNLVTTIFLGGCNFRCPFCHNSALIRSRGEKTDIPLEVLERNLTAHADWLDGVCVSGGEPTLSVRLPELLRHIKRLGLKVKLDTNGTRPDVLSELISERLIDMVAMDVKAAFDNYPRATHSAGFQESVKESVSILTRAERRGVMEAEFRTTVVPTIVDRDDVLEIAQFLGNAQAQRYFLQQFNPVDVYSQAFRALKPFTTEFIEGLAREASAFIPTRIRG